MASVFEITGWFCKIPNKAKFKKNGELPQNLVAKVYFLFFVYFE